MPVLRQEHLWRKGQRGLNERPSSPLSRILLRHRCDRREDLLLPKTKHTSEEVFSLTTECSGTSAAAQWFLSRHSESSRGSERRFRATDTSPPRTTVQG